MQHGASVQISIAAVSGAMLEISKMTAMAVVLRLNMQSKCTPCGDEMRGSEIPSLICGN